jgi:hypothetical protein
LSNEPHLTSKREIETDNKRDATGNKSILMKLNMRRSDHTAMQKRIRKMISTKQEKREVKYG